MCVCVCVLSVRVCVCPHVNRVKAVWSKCVLLYKILTELVVFFWLSFRLKVRNYLTDAALPTEQGRWDNLWAFYFSLCWKFCCDFSPISAAVMFSGILWWLYLVKKNKKQKKQQKAPHLRFSEGERQRSFVHTVMQVSVDALQRGMEAGRVGGGAHE